MIQVTHRGSFNNIQRFLHAMEQQRHLIVLDKFGPIGVRALQRATPKDSSETANSWYYKITKDKNTYIMSWHNREMAGQTPVVILLQYGHGTRNGGYVQGQDFINPAIRPVFDQMADEMWRVVKQS